ncbi:hypothetical protein Tco_1039963, partial [Tanacetum coccineum]
MEKKDTLSSCSDSEKQQMQLIQDKSKESCMVSFQQLHSHLKCLSNNDLKGSRTEDGFKRAFATLFGQDLETFTGTMFLYMDQLQKQLDKEEFQEIGSIASFKVLETQFQMFIKSRFYLDDEYVDMTRNKFLQYTRLDIPEFRDTLIQHMESVKKSIGERAQHKMEYESRVNERQIQTTEEKTDTSNALDALDASSVIIESNGTESKEQDTSSRSGNDAHVDDADIRPIYDEEPMAEVQMTADDNVSATGQQHTEQPEFNNEGKVDQNAEQRHSPLAQQRLKVNPPNGSNADIPNQCESEQALKCPLQAEQADWLEDLEDTDEEIDEQELEAHYSYMAKIQEVSPAESSSTDTPLEQVQNHDENDVFANVRRHSEQPESINDTYVLEKDDSNVIPDSSNICTNDNQVDQNAAECVDERAALANLIANLTLDMEENKTVLKQLKKANASLTQELKECKTNLDESSRALGEATSSRDSSLIALQTKQTELEKYTALNDLTSDYKILQTKLNDTLGLLAIKNIDIKEGLKTKTYEISVVNQKHDELVKKSLLTRSQFEGQLKEKSKVISDLKVKEGKDIDTMIEMDKQIKFLNEILYKRNQSIQTIHMLAPKCATYNGRSTFANPKYLKIAQSEKPRLYEIPYDTSDPANRFSPEREETMTLKNESRSKLNKDK